LSACCGISKNGGDVLQAMSFDILAPHYRWMEFILAGEKLQRCRTAFLDEIPAVRNILLLGEGHGRCLVECCRRFPHSRIICVDASERMLEEARRRQMHHNPGAVHVKFIQADVLKWLSTDEHYDLIVTNFFLDCFGHEQLERIIPQFADCATPDANWLIADFQTPCAGLKRIRARLILWAMYAFFRTITRLPAHELITPDSLLECAGFNLHRRTHSEWGLLHSDWWMR
jgi:ubiquinone/menaquinone biosynthesis C-methylase UbiE